MSKKLVSIVVLLLFSMVFLSGCTQQQIEGNTISITDMAGREVQIPVDVDEIVGVEAGALRLLVYMNVTELVAGVEDFEKRDSNKPYIMARPELQDLPSIGPIHGGDAELIAEQNPDVIFWTYAEAGEADDLQKKTGIPVVVLRYGDLDKQRDTFYESLKLIGKVLSKEERAEHLVDFFEDTIDDLNERTLGIPEEKKPSCYVGGIGYRGAHGIKSTEPDYSPLEFVNAKNVAGEIDQEHAFVDPEQILVWNPEILFVDEGGLQLLLDDLENNSEYETIKAIEEGKVYGVLPYNYYTANYGTILADSYYIGKILYPERFYDVDISKKTNEIYEELVGEGVYVEISETFGGYKKIDT